MIFQIMLQIVFIRKKQTRNRNENICHKVCQVVEKLLDKSQAEAEKITLITFL